MLQSGLWSGHYKQGGSKHPQKMVLEFADGLVRGDGKDDLGSFTLEGEYRVDGDEIRIGWIKTYDGAHSVLYTGTFDEHGVVSGKWKIGSFGDSFALQFTQKDP
ncbi:MAG: hypothetical protein QM831_43455 [Kofleriaceae bacterium]